MPALTLNTADVADYVSKAARDAWIVPDVPPDTPLRKIEKVGGGRFTASPDIGFRPDQRAAS